MNVLFWPLSNLHWYWSRTHLPHPVILPLREVEWSFGIWQAIREVDRSHQIDVIEGCETGNLFLGYLSIPYVMRLHGEPYVFAKHSNSSLHLGLRVSRKFEFMALRRATSVTSPSLWQAKEIAGDLGWPTNRIRVIPNPISPALHDAAQKTNRKSHQSESHIVLYTGRLEHRKGTIPLLRSIPYVTQAFPDVKFVIAGGRHSSIDDFTLNSALNENGIRIYTRQLGHLPWNELIHWYRRASIFVMPSYYETFGISVIEAMAFGLPVIATTAGALPEVVVDGVTGVLVPPGDSRALGEAILHLLYSPDVRHRMGQAGADRVAARFRVDRILDETLTLYFEAVRA